MNFETIIWGTLASCVPMLVFAFTLFSVFSIIRSMLMKEV